MNKNFYLAVLAGTVFSVIIGFFVFGKLLMGFYMANSLQCEGLWIQESEMTSMSLLGVLVFNLSYSVLLAYIFSRWAGVTTFMAGFQAAAIIAFLMYIGFDVYFLTMSRLYNLNLVIVDVIANTVFGGLIGGVIGYMLGRGQASA